MWILNLQTLVVSHFVLWLWHTRKMWLDGLIIQMINPSQATICQTSTNLINVSPTCFQSGYQPPLSPNKRSATSRICLVSPINLFLSPYAEICIKNTRWHWGLTIGLVWRVLVSHGSSDTNNFSLVIHTVWMGSPNLLQRWKSMWQFISHLLFTIRICKTLSLQQRYSLLDPS